ncbi:MAG: hypothetical protein QM703_18905 [Gemmatales bacterium]
MHHEHAAGPAGGAGDAGPVKIIWIKIVDNSGPRVFFYGTKDATVLYGHFPFAGNKAWADLLTKAMDEDHNIYYTVSGNNNYKKKYTYSDAITDGPNFPDVNSVDDAQVHFLVTAVSWTPI